MSVINDMLKNLEKRESNHQTIPVSSLHTHQKLKNISLYKKYFLLGSTLILLLLLIPILFNKKHTLVLTSPLKNQPIIKESLQTSAENQSWTTPALIKGITVQVKGSMTEISFLLNHPALYRLISNETQNQLAVMIDQAELQAELPASNDLNSSILRITSMSFDKDTQFNLTLAPGAIIKYANLINEDKNPELVLTIEAPTHASEKKINFNSTIIKTPVMQNILFQKYRAAMLNAKNGEYLSAISQLSSLIKMDSNFKEARLSLIALLIDQHNLSKAKYYTDEGLKLTPNSLPFIELKARLLTLDGKKIQALALLKTVSPSFQDNPDYYAFMAALYEKTNNNLLAIKLYQQLLLLNPEHGNWWFGLGFSLEKTGHIKQAMKAYKKALSFGRLNEETIHYLESHLKILEEMNHATG